MIKRSIDIFGGNVFIAAKGEIKVTEIKTEVKNCGIICSEFKSSQGSVMLCSYYKPPVPGLENS